MKDAASAAIYGSRAAAGVILVTTKRAKNKEFHLSYNGEYGINTPTAKPKFANAVQWMSGLNELAFNDGASSLHSLYSEDVINNYAQLRAEDPDRYADTDFMDLGLKSSTHHQRHSLSLSGGTEKLKTKLQFSTITIRKHLSKQKTTSVSISARTMTTKSIIGYMPMLT